jgi:hypothetical protein
MAAMWVKFENIAAGEYVIEIARKGFLPRYGKVTVAGSNYMNHHELLAGDVNGDLVVNEKDLAAIRMRIALYKNKQYNAMYDFGGSKSVSMSCE